MLDGIKMDESWILELKALSIKTSFTQADFNTALTLKVLNIPSKLYKYRSISDYSLYNLYTDTLHLSLASDFNDPYDCALTFDTQFGLKEYEAFTLNSFNFTDEVLQEIKHSADPFYALLDNILKAHPKLTKAEKKQYDKLIKNHETKKASTLKKFNDVIRSQIKICSLSERIDSLLMWGHYASSHTGFAMEYDFSGTPIVHHLAAYLWPVLYDNKLYDASHILNNFDPDNWSLNFWMRALPALHKSCEWQYEKEWRLVVPGSTKKIPDGNIDAGKPTAIYLGAKISDEDAAVVSFMAKTKHIPVFRMRMSATEFRMIYEKIKF